MEGNDGFRTFELVLYTGDCIFDGLRTACAC